VKQEQVKKDPLVIDRKSKVEDGQTVYEELCRDKDKKLFRRVVDDSGNTIRWREVATTGL